jgi:hypothetical protein
LFDTARQSDFLTLRETTLVAVGRLLQNCVVGWETIEPWVNSAVDDENVEVRQAGVEAIGRGVGGGQVRWNTVEPRLNEYIFYDEPIAKEAIRAARVGLQEGAVEWRDVTNLLEASRRVENTLVAEEAIRTVGVCLQEGTVEWENVGNFLERACQNDDTLVAEVAVEAVRASLSTSRGVFG